MAIKPSTWLGIGGGVLVTIAVGLGGWNLSETADVPKVYSTKAEVKEVKDDAAKDRDEIRQDVKEGFVDLRTEQRRVVDTVNELNRYLRDKIK